MDCLLVVDSQHKLHDGRKCLQRRNDWVDYGYALLVVDELFLSIHQYSFLFQFAKKHHACQNKCRNQEGEVKDFKVVRSNVAQSWLACVARRTRTDARGVKQKQVYSAR